MRSPIRLIICFFMLLTPLGCSSSSSKNGDTGIRAETQASVDTDKNANGDTGIGAETRASIDTEAAAILDGAVGSSVDAPVGDAPIDSVLLGASDGDGYNNDGNSMAPQIDGIINSDTLLSASVDAPTTDSPVLPPIGDGSVDSSTEILDSGAPLFVENRSDASTILNANVYVLSASSVEGIIVGDETLTFVKPGNESLLARKPGDIVVSPDGSFLRRIVSISDNGDVIACLTTDASLEDAIQDGELDTSFNLGTESTLHRAVASIGSGISTTIGGNKLSLKNGLSLSTDGSINYKPALHLSVGISKSKLTSASATLEGKLTAGFNLRLTSSASASDTVSATLWKSPSYRAYQLIGGVFPVGEEISLYLDASASVSVESKISVSMGYNMTSDLVLGAAFKAPTWSGSGTSDFSYSVTPVGPTYEGKASATYKVTFTPHVDIVLFPLNKNIANAKVVLSAPISDAITAKYASGSCVTIASTLNFSGGAKGSLSALGATISSPNLSLFNKDIPVGDTISIDTEGYTCNKGSTLHCGKTGTSICCREDGYEYPVFCDTGDDETMSCWNGKDVACSTVMMCNEKRHVCLTGETPHCDASLGFFCCDASHSYFLTNLGAASGCWSGIPIPSTIIQCSDGSHRGCYNAGEVASCSSEKCTKANSTAHAYREVAKGSSNRGLEAP